MFSLSSSFEIFVFFFGLFLVDVVVCLYMCFVACCALVTLRLDVAQGLREIVSVTDSFSVTNTIVTASQKL